LKGTSRSFARTVGKPTARHCRALSALQKGRCNISTENFTSHVLHSFSRPRAKLLKRLNKQAQYQQNKLRRRKLVAVTRLQRGTEQQRGAIARVPAACAINRFLQQAPTAISPAPLFFNRPVYNLLRGQATSVQGARSAEEISLENFRATLQYTSSLERLVPELLSFFIIKHIKNEASSFARIKKLITVTYWNLRVYLSIDPTMRRLALRDNNFRLLKFLRVVSIALAGQQNVNHASCLTIRQRLQPTRLHRAPVTSRFRQDWLRWAFPLKHALYQESAEEYGDLLLLTKQIVRTTPSTRGAQFARTKMGSTAVSRRTEWLINLKHLTATPRLEMVFKTAKRPLAKELVAELSTTEMPATQNQLSPWLEYFASKKSIITVKVLKSEKGRLSLQQRSRSLSAEDWTKSYRRRVDRITDNFRVVEFPSKLMNHIRSVFGLYNPKLSASFFARSFYTGSLEKCTIITKYTRRRYRLFEEIAVGNSALETISRRYRLKKRFVARGRLSFVVNPASYVVKDGILDPWSVRQKSARSGQYLWRQQEKPLKKVTNVQRLKFVKFSKLSSENDSGALSTLVRENRKVTYSGIDALKVNKLADTNLRWTRVKIQGRRQNSFLKSQVLTVKKHAYGSQLNHVLTRISPSTASVTALGKAVTTKEDVISLISEAKRRVYPVEQHVANYVSTSERSLLRNRASFPWVPRTTPSKQPVLLQQAIQLSLRCARILRVRQTVDDKLTDLLQRHKQLQHLLRVKSTKVIRWRVRRFLRLLTQRIRLLLTRRRTAQQRGGLVTAALKGSYSAAVQISTSEKALLAEAEPMSERISDITQDFRQIKTNANVFSLQTLPIRAKHSQFSQLLLKLAATRKTKPFDRFRSILWYRLTSRWTKRFRMVRRWIKHTNWWLRDHWMSRKVFIRPVVGRNLFVPVIPKIVKGHSPTITQISSLLQKERKRFNRLFTKTVEQTNNLIIACHTLPQAHKGFIKSTERMHETHARPLFEQEKLEDARARSEQPMYSLKLSANYRLPYSHWKATERRVRTLEWRESNDAFVLSALKYRRNPNRKRAFQFTARERSYAPWLEPLIYTRSMSSTNRREFRRHQLPHEQKKFKWLQRVRKKLYANRGRSRYIRWRRWPQQRRYNQKLYYSLFNLPNMEAARRHFRKLAGTHRHNQDSFVYAQKDLSTRLDNVLVQLNLVPTIYWARVVVKQGLLRINGQMKYRADYKLTAGDIIEPVWDLISCYQQHFINPLPRGMERERPHRFSIGAMPKNFEFNSGTRCIIYHGAPKEIDLRKSHRINPAFFRAFQLEAGVISKRQ
jgi:ribosomal protein S4